MGTAGLWSKEPGYLLPPQTSAATEAPGILAHVYVCLGWFCPCCPIEQQTTYDRTNHDEDRGSLIKSALCCCLKGPRRGRSCGIDKAERSQSKFDRDCDALLIQDEELGREDDSEYTSSGTASEHSDDDVTAPLLG